MVLNKPSKGCRKPVVHERHCGGAIFGLNAKCLELFLPKNHSKRQCFCMMFLLSHPFRRFRSEIKFNMNTKIWQLF